MDEIWDVWFPAAGATGLSFGRSRVAASDAGDRVLIHAAPQAFTVTVRDADGAVVAEGTDLKRSEEGPMSFLVRDGKSITLEDGWPSPDDIGRVVLLPGGEAGIIRSWWHADDRSEWRWTVEFSNSR